ncbi:MAG TPA: hypothetical protein VFV65_06315 [Gemmatimonadales bacterium]|nr:hypothetical protein [Gemmatimonadales bacterium]
MPNRTRWTPALGLGLLALAGCRLESHPPAGVPADEAAIRSAVAASLAKSAPWARILRTDVRQDRDLASVWLVTSPPPSEGEGDRITLLVLRREVAGWAIQFEGSPTRTGR